MCLNGLKKKLRFICPFCDSEKEAEKLRERLAQEEAEAMEMEDEENKIENANNVKEVGKKSNLEASAPVRTVVNSKINVLSTNRSRKKKR